jgi:hypothetical protein
VTASVSSCPPETKWAKVVGPFADKFPSPLLRRVHDQHLVLHDHPTALQFIDNTGAKLSVDEFGIDFPRREVLSE